MCKKNKIIFFLLLMGTISFAQRESTPVELEKISDNLYQIQGGRGATGGLYIGDSGVLVIDSKMDKKSVDQTIIEIQKLTDLPIKYLVNTHSDGDHIVGNQYFAEDIVFVSHKNCRKDFYLPGRDGSPSIWEQEELAPFVPSITFTDKLDLYLGTKKVELWYFGTGHTTGDAVLYFPEEKTAFLGDQLFLGRIQLIHKHKNGNSFEHVKTLSKMLNTLDAEKFCSGHSKITDKAGIMDHIYHMKKRQNKVRSLILDGKKIEEIQDEFSAEEKTLVTSIFKEIVEEGC